MTRIVSWYLFNFYPRPPRGGRHPPSCGVDVPLQISIHALREEGDLALSLPTGWSVAFLSTPSARRATRREDDEPRHDKISIHALREEGDDCVEQVILHILISIHALREEGDRSPTRRKRSRCYFYPRPPRGGRRDRHAVLRRPQ